MYMPIEIQEMPADTTVMGDIDAFIAYIESGQALNEWQKCHAKARQEIERDLRSHHRLGRHPMDSRGNAAVSGGEGLIPV
jgi:hypothetical protein